MEVPLGSRKLTCRLEYQLLPEKFPGYPDYCKKDLGIGWRMGEMVKNGRNLKHFREEGYITLNRMLTEIWTLKVLLVTSQKKVSRTEEKASILILRRDFYAPQVRSPPAAVTECGYVAWKSCEVYTFCDFLFKLLNICFINVCLQTCLKIQYGVFWTWGVK